MSNQNIPPALPQPDIDDLTDLFYELNSVAPAGTRESQEEKLNRKVSALKQCEEIIAHHTAARRLEGELQRVRRDYILKCLNGERDALRWNLGPFVRLW